MDQAGRLPRLSACKPMESPDAEAIRKILSVEPRLQGLERASRALGLGRNDLVHAGPPIRDPASVCRPVLHSAITATLFEGWADSVEQAESLVRNGGIRLRAAQDLNCVVPLADVVSPSMWLQAVGDEAQACWTPLNGGMEHVLRVGMLGDDVLAHLRWLNGPFAETFAAALTAPVPILDLADEGLAGGDDCHGRTGVASAALLSTIDRHLVSPKAHASRAFLQRSPSFFLNIWMAASQRMLAAARGVSGSTVVTAAGGNGIEFGIKIASTPDTWFAAPADPPAVAPGALGAAEPLGAIGDSAVVDILGLGAMTRLELGAAPAIPAFVEHAERAGALLSRPHPRFARTHPCMIMSAQAVVESGTLPIISLGVLDRAGRLGRLAGGYYRPPLEIFERAVTGKSRCR